MHNVNKRRSKSQMPSQEKELLKGAHTHKVESKNYDYISIASSSPNRKTIHARIKGTGKTV